VGSGLIILGSRGGGHMLAIGIALTAIAFFISVYLALRPDPRKPRPSIVQWSIGGVAAFYIACAIAAGVLAGKAYGIATLLAGLIPATAVALTLATAREKTAPSVDDATADAGGDPHPGIGMDDKTPLGDTPEHSDAEGDPHAERERRLGRFYRRVPDRQRRS
jgi:hypothetical protein